MKCQSLVAVLSISVATASLAGSLAIADPVSDNLAARTEVHAIETLTLSDRQFLEGDATGKATTTAGELRIAAGAGRLPVVVLQHGSGGVGANVEMWERDPRHRRFNICTRWIDRPWIRAGNHRPSIGWPPQLRTRHISRARRLGQAPARGFARIALMGFSRGGHAALSASLTRFHKMWNKSGIAFAAYIPVYPDCATAYISDTEVADSPIRIFGGTPDD